MATVQQFIHWLKKEKSKGGCIKMAAPDMNPSHNSITDDSYGMNRFLKQEKSSSKSETFSQNENVKPVTTKIDTFNSAMQHENGNKLETSGALPKKEKRTIVETSHFIQNENNNKLELQSSCRASMKLPPIPREEGRTRWVPSGRPRAISAESPAHIYEEIAWSAVETDTEEYESRQPKIVDTNFNRKNVGDRNFSSTGAQNVTSNFGRSSDRHLDIASRNTQSAKSSSTTTVSHGGNTNRKLDFSTADAQSMNSNRSSRRLNPPASQSRTSNSTLNQGCEPYLVVQLTHGQKQNSSEAQNTKSAKTDTNNAQGLPSGSVAMDTNCVDHLLVEDGLEKYAGNFTQCTKCNRPHGLFNGTQIKHFDEHGEEGYTDACTFDRLSVRTRSSSSIQGNSNTSTHGFRRAVPSSKFAPKVRTNPRISERNFRFNRSTSFDNSNSSSGQSGLSDSSCQPIGTGVKVPESDSADTCNEYDIQTGSEHSNRTSGKSSTSGGSRSSIASDSAASNLYSSESSNDSLKSRQISRERSKLNESDSSNDTFSEYDIRSSDSYSSSKGMADEYDFYLTKIRQNLMLKHETLRVIRESESSEYETSEYQSSSRGSSVYTSSDVSVMTSLGNGDVTNCSAFDESRDVKIRSILKNKSCPSLQNRPKRSIVFREDGSRSKSGSSHHHHHHASNPSVHARKKPNRRKSTGALPVTLECYTLPDFGSDSSGSTVSEGHQKISRHSPTLLGSSTGSTGSGAAADSSMLDTSSVSYSGSGSDSELLDRLSCRVTNYKPGTPPLVPSGGNGSGSSALPLGGGVSAFTKVNSSSSGSSKVKVDAPLKVTGSVATHAQRHAQSRPQHNRLLTDIMKLNHDRQLLFL